MVSHADRSRTSFRDPVGIATAVARRLTIDFDDAELVAHDPNGIVRLLPTDIVARITFPQTLSRTAESIETALVVAAHAFARGAPVTTPTTHISPGPHLEEGAFVSLWQWVPSGGDWEPTKAGRGLREVHDALAELPVEDLPHCHLDEIKAILTDTSPGPVVSADDLAFLREERYRLMQLVETLEGQAVHGDAHLGNVVWSPKGPVWADWEMVCKGPVELDLAALLLRSRIVGDAPGVTEAIEGYGPFDRNLVEQLIPMVGLMTTAWMLKVHQVSTTKVPAEALQARMAWWRDRRV